MTLKQRIRAVTDALGENEWLKVSAIFEALGGSTYASVQSVITSMYRSGQLRRRGTPPNCEYRSGRTPVVAKTLGRPPRSRLGFMELARLEREDPAAWRRATKGGRL